jgi:macrolide transport system ATP-binding/permease protein
MTNIRQDLRSAFRIFAGSPGYTAVAILTLALGLGANTAIFSVVNALLVRPLPIFEADRVLAVYTANSRSPYGPTSYPEFADYRDQNRAFSGMAAYRNTQVNVTVGNNVDRVQGELVSGEYFDVLGVGAQIGRTFLPEDDHLPGGNPVAVLSFGLWPRAFGSDPDLIGSPIRLNGVSYTVIGIAPRSFRGITLRYVPEIWLPMASLPVFESTWAEAFDREGWRLFHIVGRLDNGVTIEQANGNLDTVAAESDVSLAPANSAIFAPAIRGSVSNYAGTMLAVVAVVLLIACLNVANLVMARTTARRKEMAIRSSLGASRGRLSVQLLTENILMALTAGVLGLLIALWVTDFLSAFRPPSSLPVTLDLDFDWRVLTFAFVLSASSGLALGMAAVWNTTRRDLTPALKDGTDTEVPHRFFRSRDVMLAGQVALSLLLLTGAGLLVRTVQSLDAIDPGFNPDNVLTLAVDPEAVGLSETEGRRVFSELTDRLSATPGVTSVSLTQSLPINPERRSLGTFAEGYTPAPDEETAVDVNRAGLDYFRTMQIEIVEGRDFNDRDVEASPRVAIVNESLVRRFWPGQDPVGKRLGFNQDMGYEVVGVVRDVKIVSLREGPRPHIYLPYTQLYDFFGSSMNLVVRSSLEPKSVVATARREARSIAPGLSLYDIKTLSDHVSASILQERQAATLLSVFGILALLLASMGIYGVISFSVSQRTHEIGVRMALGADKHRVLTLMLRQGLVPPLVGVIAGIGAAVVSTSALDSMLFGVRSTDPATMAVVTAILILVALVASFVPARRALNIDPMAALRHE